MPNITVFTVLLYWKIWILQYFWNLEASYIGSLTPYRGTHWTKLQASKVIQSEHTDQCHTYISIHTTVIPDDCLSTLHMMTLLNRLQEKLWSHNQYLMIQCQPKCGHCLPEPQVVLLSHPVRQQDTSYTKTLTLWNKTVWHKIKVHGTSYIPSTTGMNVCHCQSCRSSCYH
jgi:hypothetical protein